MRIFISYRRDDTAGYAGRLYDRLVDHFGQGSLFMDIDTIEPGQDFVKVIQQAVGSYDVLIALIGKGWTTTKDEEGKRRLDDPNDFVHLELATALQSDIRVIPVLVGGATMPGRSELPDPLRTLRRRNALEISDTRFHHDVNRLITALEAIAEKLEEAEGPPKRETTPPPAKPLLERLRAVPTWGLIGGGVVILGLAGRVLAGGAGLLGAGSRPGAAPRGPAEAPPEQQSPRPNLTATAVAGAAVTPTTAPPTPTSGPAPTATVPHGIPFVRINDITLQANRYVVEYETFEYTEVLPGMHVHFFFNTVQPEQAGVPGSGPWVVYGGPRPFTEYGVSDRPDFSTQMCALVANADHSIQLNSGTCFDLPT